MKRVSWLTVLVFAMALTGITGIASADQLPAAPPLEEAAVAPVAPTASTLITQEALAVNLAQIFEAPGEPEKKWSACTPSQCRQGCAQPGCVSVCINLQTCECDVICH